MSEPSGPSPSESEGSELTPERMIRRLLRLLTLEPLDTDLFRGAYSRSSRGRVFGGQVIAQALQAAAASVDASRIVHSLHAYFMRPGESEIPVIYQVMRDFEGRSFATRRVVAMQRGIPILTMAASFHVPEPGHAHQIEMPDVPEPDSVKSEAEHWASMDSMPEQVRAMMLRARPIEVRLVNPPSALGDKRPAVVRRWFKAVAPLPDDPAMHRAVLAFASDMGLLSTASVPHGFHFGLDKIQAASLDHALWFHEPFRADEWMLYATDSPWSGHARGFNRGSIFSREGRLIASVAQEGLIRDRRLTAVQADAPAST